MAEDRLLQAEEVGQVMTAADAGEELAMCAEL